MAPPDDDKDARVADAAGLQMSSAASQYDMQAVPGKNQQDL